MSIVLYGAGCHSVKHIQKRIITFPICSVIKTGCRNKSVTSMNNENLLTSSRLFAPQFKLKSNYCTRMSRQLSVPPNTSKQKGKKPPTKFRQYVLSRYMQFVDRYERILESKFPSAMHVYRIFTIGIKDFYRDLKSFFVIVKRLNNTPGGLRCLSRSEIELYFQMPRDMKKVAPVLLFSALPLTNYIVFPLMYWFPRQLLCSHFWSLQQRVEFAVHAHRKRLLHNRPVFRALQAQLDCMEGSPLYCDWSHILGLLGSGVHPTADEILRCIDLFRGEPYHIINIYSGHVKNLLQMHGMHTGWRRRTRLSDRALIIRHMDLAILREGGPQKMTHDELRWVGTYSLMLKELPPQLGGLESANALNIIQTAGVVSASMDLQTQLVLSMRLLGMLSTRS